jgi:hypothetical protein
MVSLNLTRYLDSLMKFRGNINETNYNNETN